MMPIIEDGHLIPLMRAGQVGLNSFDFSANSAAKLLASMPAVVGEEYGGELLPLPVAAQQVRLTVSKAISMVQAGELLVRGFDASAVGLQRYLVNLPEVVNAGRRRRLPGYSQQEAAKIIGVHYNAMLDFVERGVISTITYGRETIVVLEEIERFQREYVAVPELSVILGFKRSRGTIAALARVGVEPACPRSPFWKVLYRRDEAVAVAKHLAAAEC